MARNTKCEMNIKDFVNSGTFHTLCFVVLGVELRALLVKQVLYHLGHAPNPFCSGYFGDRVLHLCPGWFGP
jgi:hypothetical protein